MTKQVPGPCHLRSRSRMGTFLSRQSNPELARNLSRAYTEGSMEEGVMVEEVATRKDGDIKQACA